MTLQRYSVGRFGEMHGFTLIELLATVVIMAILSGLLLVGLNVAMTTQARMRALKDVRTIQAALENYYEEYVQYPNPDMLPPATMESDRVPILRNLANLLQGSDFLGGNPRTIEFVTFQRVDAQGAPLNPWSDVKDITEESDSDLDLYYCKFDMNSDRIISGTGMSELEMVPENDVRKSVIVWTYRPHPKTGEILEVIKSW